MNISYFDDARVTEKILQAKSKKLAPYREAVAAAASVHDLTIPEASLYYASDVALHDMLARLQQQYKRVKRVILIGIGGSSLGAEAVHAVLNQGKVILSVLDTISVSKLNELKRDIAPHKKASDIVVCVISKSGGTTETLANAAALLEVLQLKFGDAIYQQTIFVGNPGSDLLRYGRKMQVECVMIPEAIGGRYSVATAVGLVPLALLGHDVDEFIMGYLDAMHPTIESVVADSAARLATYHTLKYPHYTFFACETRLEKLGGWYRQLFAESLGKAEDLHGKEMKHVIVPTIITPVELHSVGQLYMSGVPDVYTDFVSFDDEELDVMLSKKAGIAPTLKGYSLQEVSTAIYGGVIAAYQEKQLPYRATVFEEELAYSLGQFMAMRLREVMYTARLLDLNAFDQPNVELYKQKTKEILHV